MIAAAMLVAMLVANHWQLQAVDASTALRLNRWTGDVEICFVDNKSVPENGSLAGANLSVGVNDLWRAVVARYIPQSRTSPSPCDNGHSFGAILHVNPLAWVGKFS